MVVRTNTSKTSTVSVSSNLKEFKRLAIKGLYNLEMTFDDYLTVLLKEARSEKHLTRLKARNLRTKTELAA